MGEGMIQLQRNCLGKYVQSWQLGSWSDDEKFSGLTKMRSARFRVSSMLRALGFERKMGPRPSLRSVSQLVRSGIVCKSTCYEVLCFQA